MLENHTSTTERTRQEGEAALQHLLAVTRRNSGQSRTVSRFLLSLYNGNRFPFDLSDFRALEPSVFDACISVLRMDGEIRREVHTYFKNGDEIWQKMIAHWGFKDHYAKESWR